VTHPLPARTPARTASARTAARRRRRRRRRVVGAVVVVAALGAVGTGVWVTVQRLDLQPAAERCTAVLDGTEWYLSPAQADNAALVAGTAVRRGLPARAATIGLATALQESKLINVAYGDRDSLGLFQQRPSQGWGTAEQVQDPVHATGAFYDALVRVPGYADLPVTEAAQAVQRSGFPDAYAQHEARSRAWASALAGYSPAALSCELGPVDAERSPGAVAEAFAARLERDLGLTGDAVTLDAAGPTAVVRADALPGGDPARAAWAVAQWAVATAAVTDAVEVRVGDQMWTRRTGIDAGRGDGAAWRPVDRPELETGVVEVDLHAAG